VPPGQLGRAVAQIAAGQNGSRMIAPGIAGALIGFSGTASCFWALAATFFAAFAFNWQIPASPGRRGDGRGMLGTMVAGFRHIRERPALMGLMLLAAVPTVLALPYQALLPVFAREVYDVGPGGLGMLMTMIAVGAFAGAVVATMLASLPCRGPILLLSGMAVGLGLVLLGLASSYPLGLAMLFLTGAAFSVYNAVNNTLIHEATTDAFRGRVMSVYLMTWSLMPLGTLPAGALADHVGAPLTVALGGGLCALVVGLVWLALPALRALR